VSGYHVEEKEGKGAIGADCLICALFDLLDWLTLSKGFVDCEVIFPPLLTLCLCCHYTAHCPSDVAIQSKMCHCGDDLVFDRDVETREEKGNDDSLIRWVT
jgi:hypothetical protein